MNSVLSSIEAWWGTVISKTPAGRYRSRIYHKGVQIIQRTFDRKRDAVAWEQEQYRALRNDTWSDPRTGNVPFGEVIDRYIETMDGVINPHTFDTDRDNLHNHVPAELQRFPIASITAPKLNALYVLKLKSGLAHGTVARIRDSISAVFAWAVTEGIVTTNPVHQSKLPPGLSRSLADVRAIQPDDLTLILEAMRAKHRLYSDYVEFLVLTGLRWGEFVDLRVRNYSQQPAPYIRIETSASDGYGSKSTKNRRHRSVPLTRRADEILRACMRSDAADDDRIFTAVRGGRLTANAFKRSLHWKATSRGYRIHDLRHTAASHWLAAGVELTTVSAWLGHSNASITLHVYAHYLGQHADQRAVTLLDNLADNHNRLTDDRSRIIPEK